MKFRRHMPPLHQWRLPALRFPAIPEIEREEAIRWAFWLVVALGLGYLIAAIFVFPAPLFPHHQEVPRVLGMSIGDARRAVTTAHFVPADAGSEPHPFAPVGTVIWQDPPPGVEAPSAMHVALTVSAGPPRVPVPDVTGLDALLASRLITAAGLTVSRVESVQAAFPTGLTMVTRPAAATALAPRAGVGLVISRGAPTITVPDLLGLSVGDARTKLEGLGLELGGVTRKRTTESTPGTIIAQRPAAGTLAAPGTDVDVVSARLPQ
jgi:serine/threonine-protein kinase